MTTTIVLLDTADHDTVDAWKPQGQTREKKNMKRAHPSLGGGSGVSSLEVLELDSCSTYSGAIDWFVEGYLRRPPFGAELMGDSTIVYRWPGSSLAQSCTY